MLQKSGKPVIPVGLIFNSNNLHFRSKICVRLGKPIYASDYGLTPESTPREMRQMKQDIMQAIRELVEENPPFPIKHDQPHKQSSVDRHRAERLETIHHQEEAAAEQAAKEQQE